LVDEAAAMSLFGGKRAIWIEPAGEDIGEGVAALLDAPPPESPVIAIAGDLKASSALRKLAEASPAALTFMAYPLDAAEAARMVAELGRRYGLKISPFVAARIAEATGNDQAVAAQELQKLALYIDASPQSPRDLDHDALDAVGAELDSANLQRLADLALSGDIDGLAGELARLPEATQAIPAVRSLQRRLLMLAPARARIERGERVDAVMTSLGKALFWKDKPIVARMLEQWSAADLARLAERSGRLERELIFAPVPEQDALGEELLSIARAARRRK
jgi:DNA polymerase-3 subunit delta